MLNLVFSKKVYFWIGVVFVVLILFGNSGMRSIVSCRIELANLGKKLNEIEKENRELRIRLYNFENNPTYIEREARKKLGLIQSGEVKYRFAERQMMNDE